MSLISKYLLSHLTKNFGAVLLVLSLIALGRHFVKLITQSSSGQLPPSLLLSLLSFEIPDLLSLLLPLSLFFAILMAYGKLYAEQEIPVLLASGLSWWRLWWVPFSLALVLALVVLALQFWLPQIHYQKELKINQLGIADRLALLTPGRFQLIANNKMVIYLEDVNSDKEFSNVFIAEQPVSHQQSRSLLLAQAGRVQREQEGAYYLVLEQGTRYEGIPGQADYHVTYFKRYGQLLDPQWSPVQLARRMMSFRELAQAGTGADWAEWQARISLPISVLVLATMAVPLSRVRRGQGRYAKLLGGILLFILYFNLLTVCRRLMISETFPPMIGVWWIHGLFLSLGLAWAVKQAGWPVRRSNP